MVYELIKERAKVIEAMNSCCTESGCIKNEHKYRYQILANTEKAFEVVIKWMEAGKEVTV